MSKPKLEWAEKGEAEDFDAAAKFLSLLCSDTNAKALVKSLRNSKLVQHAAKDLLRAAHLPLLPSDDSHVRRGSKANSQRQGARARSPRSRWIAAGLPLVVADGYHRICAVCYFDESAPIPCRIADIDHGRP